MPDQLTWKSSALRNLVESNTHWQGVEDSLRIFLDVWQFNSSLERNTLRYTPLKASAVHLFRCLIRPATKTVPKSLHRDFISSVPAWVTESLARRRIVAELWLSGLSPRAQPYYEFLQECHRERNFDESFLGSVNVSSERRRVYFNSVVCAKLLHAGGEQPKALEVLQIARSIAPDEFVPRKRPHQLERGSISDGGNVPKTFNKDRWALSHRQHGKITGLENKMR